ncbi:hypothetical protein ACQP00_18810 [Dactylosporangium sp. CS-047395]|uniref:hypothetical protein n=1 Tax=Dactylosporangium sp. CS-047395 TaxID=3239936 RepID=UPI003D8DD66A
MNCKTQVVLAAGIGYLLGRQRKLRWGLLLGAAAATGRLSRPGSVLDHGLRALKSTPELGKLGEMGGPLLASAKDAAMAAVSNRVGSMSDRLRGRDEDEEPEEEPQEERKPEQQQKREPEQKRERQREPEQKRQREPEPEPEPQDEYEDEEEDDDELATAGPPPRRRRAPVRRRREE